MKQLSADLLLIVPVVWVLLHIKQKRVKGFES